MIRRLGRLAAILFKDRIPLRDRPFASVDTDLRSPGDAVRWIGAIAIAADAREALFCHPRSAVTWRVTARPGDVITAGCSLLPDVWPKNTGGVAFTIRVTVDGTDRAASATLVASPGVRDEDRRWLPLQVQVPLDAVRPVTIELSTAVPDGAAVEHAWAVWGDPAIVRRRPIGEVATALAGALGAARSGGARAAVRHITSIAGLDRRTVAYRRWARDHSPDARALARMAAEAARLEYQPVISIITPVYNTDPAFLRACIASVQAQAYPRWELCLADDGSTSAATIAVLREQTDPRIKVTSLARNARISAASNAALALATGEFVALLDHDDELTPDALYRVVSLLNGARDADLVYSDEDKRDADGGLSEPFFKPCWSPEHLLSAAYTCHLTVARKSLVDRIGGFRLGYEGAQDHDLTLRLSDITPRIHHLPYVLYHWRRTPESTASAGSAKPWADDAGKRALEDYLARHAIDGEVVSGGVPGLYRVRFAIRGTPLVSVILAGGDEARASRLRERIGYSHVEMLTAADSTAALNDAARRAAGAHLLFVDAGLDPLDREWLTALLEYSQQDGIGAVGARIEYADGRLRHIGIVTCLDGGPAAVFDGHTGDSYGYFSSAIGVRNYAAVSGECLMTRRDVFDRLGGFDARLPRFGADVDYCARVQAAELRIVFTPYARLRYVAAPQPRVWPDPTHDPYYNKNLSTTDCYLVDTTDP
jgi:GT2 family glycosyltransferase